jgi:uncharacterized membrane protein
MNPDTHAAPWHHRSAARWSTVKRSAILAPAAVALLVGLNPDGPAAIELKTDAALAQAGLVAPTNLSAAAKPSEFATISILPSFGRGGEAVAIDEAGTFIAGYATDDSGLRHTVEWTLQGDGSWAVTDLPWLPGATRTSVTGVNNRGEAAGDDYPATPSHALLWPGGTSAPLILNCPTDVESAIVHGISADAQVLVGNVSLTGQDTSVAAVWQPGICREDLPLPVGQVAAAAHAVNADGTIAGGVALGPGTAVPVRWTNVAGEWRIEELDTRRGEVRGANGAGDLAGFVVAACGAGSVCQRAIVWYADGSEPTQLGTLGGQDSLGFDINSAGEVTGIAMTRREAHTAFLWSSAGGMVQLPFKGRSAQANALSDVRPDGTRLVVGVAVMGSRGEPAVWVVRNP